MLPVNDDRRNYLTRQEAARLMRGTVRWLEELQRRGDGPALRENRPEDALPGGRAV